MKLESILRKKETSAAVAPAVAEPKPTAREAWAAFFRGEYAAAIQAAHEAGQEFETARATMSEREGTLADARQRAQAAAAANDREGFRTAKLDVEFYEQQYAIDREAVSDAERKQREIAQRLADFENKRIELIVAVIMEVAREHESELHRLEAECLKHFAALDATLNHFRVANVVGKPVEELSEIFQRLHEFAILKDEHRETARKELRELLDNLNH